MDLCSRKQQRESEMYSVAARRGIKYCYFYLYRSEIRTLIDQGFDVNPTKDSKDAVLCKVSWENPFKFGIPMIVHNYLLGEVETFPRNLSWAQELYVISSVPTKKKAEK